jgi:hypothetical protein
MSGFDADAVVAAMAPMLGLPLHDADPAVVALHLRIAAGMAEVVGAVDLPEEAEPLPVFRP